MSRFYGSLCSVYITLPLFIVHQSKNCSSLITIKFESFQMSYATKLCPLRSYFSKPATGGGGCPPRKSGDAVRVSPRLRISIHPERRNAKREPCCAALSHEW